MQSEQFEHRNQCCIRNLFSKLESPEYLLNDYKITNDFEYTYKVKTNKTKPHTASKKKTKTKIQRKKREKMDPVILIGIDVSIRLISVQVSE